MDITLYVTKKVFNEYTEGKEVVYTKGPVKLVVNKKHICKHRLNNLTYLNPN